MVFPHGRSSRTDSGISCYARLYCIAPNQPWTVWQGGECPIPDGLEFEVITRAGLNIISLISCYELRWEHEDIGTDIIAYRLTGKVLEGLEL